MSFAYDFVQQCPYIEKCVDILFVVTGDEGSAEADAGGGVERRLHDVDHVQVVDSVWVTGTDICAV